MDESETAAGLSVGQMEDGMSIWGFEVGLTLFALVMLTVTYLCLDKYRGV